jgi:hypothetical protein
MSLDPAAQAAPRWARVEAWLANPRAALGLAAGALLLGLVAGWLLARPDGDVSPADLGDPWRSLYLQTAADAFVRENDVARARLRLQAFDDEALSLQLSQLANDPSAGAISRSNVSELAAALGVTLTAASGLPAAPASRSALVDRAWLALVAAAVALLALGAWLMRSGLRRRAGGAAGEPSEPAPDAAFAATRPPGRGRVAPPWRPGRLYLGDTTTAHYRAAQEPFYQSYLVHSDRGVLVGSVSMQSQRIGSVNTVDVWLVERDDEGSDSETPLVTFAARAAVDDSVFRARLSDRNLVAAVPGQRALLETAHLVLEIQVRQVEPDPARDGLRLELLTLTLAPGPAVAGSPSAGPDEVEPPIPLPFRAD